MKPYILEKSSANGFDFYKYLFIRGGSGNWKGRGEKFRNGGEFDFILYYAAPEDTEGKPQGMCERLWCIEKGIPYGEGRTINEAYADLISKNKTLASPGEGAVIVDPAGLAVDKTKEVTNVN